MVASKGAVKNHPVRNTLPADLPRVETIIEPIENTTDCKIIGEEITEILELEMPKLFVQRFVRPKYIKADGSGILIGDLPTRPIEKRMAARNCWLFWL